MENLSFILGSIVLAKRKVGRTPFQLIKDLWIYITSCNSPKYGIEISKALGSDVDGNPYFMIWMYIVCWEYLLCVAWDSRSQSKILKELACVCGNLASETVCGGLFISVELAVRPQLWTGGVCSNHVFSRLQSWGRKKFLMRISCFQNTGIWLTLYTRSGFLFTFGLWEKAAVGPSKIFPEVIRMITWLSWDPNPKVANVVSVFDLLLVLCIGWLIAKSPNIKATTLTSKKTLNLFANFPLPPPQPFGLPTACVHVAELPAHRLSCSQGSLSLPAAPGVLVKKPDCLITGVAGRRISRGHSLRPAHCCPMFSCDSFMDAEEELEIKWWYHAVKFHFSGWIIVLKEWLTMERSD